MIGKKYVINVIDFNAIRYVICTTKYLLQSYLILGPPSHTLILRPPNPPTTDQIADSPTDDELNYGTTTSNATAKTRM